MNEEVDFILYNTKEDGGVTWAKPVSEKSLEYCKYNFLCMDIEKGIPFFFRTDPSELFNKGTKLFDSGLTYKVETEI